ncbi:hypothetical protein MBM09_11925 [Flaviramulus sp. BrNp1-15]|uniref:hypothetical protein n=1 Tax=Flaviramulus sp. BrNp1-15 TaxID=2916754 RepID=UPI001EE84C7F|nr:hypothetical protein [Flaviramulus sp. BrNp1-15]ULC58627.1 hypothetical protein MBM09_11925 [Flaviramulus sp. BrNp1-15]
MIRLQLKPSILKSLNFNKENESLEIEFKKDIKTAKHIEIPLSIIKDYVNSLKENILFENEEDNHSNLRIVYSNFKTSLN